MRPEGLRLLQDLIAFDTTSHKSNLELISHVRNYLAQYDIESQLTYNAEGTKANLYATAGPGHVGGVALSGHTDVVPIDGQEWCTDPWTLTEAEGRLYGRGACDMKGFIAIALSFVPDFIAAPLKRPVHFCFSFDEELGCHGVPHLLAELADKPVKPAMCIVGEPTGMNVVTSHKGVIDMAVHVRGKEVHSSRAPQGINAISAAARLIAYLDDIARQKSVQGPFDREFEIAHTTIQTGTIKGGTQLNIVPGDCAFEFDIRNLPGDDPDDIITGAQAFVARDLEPGMKAVDPACGFSWRKDTHLTSFEVPPDSDVVVLAKSLAGRNHTEKVTFGTEAGLFQQAQIPAVICGPGSIDQAHKANEYVSLSQLE